MTPHELPRKVNGGARLTLKQRALADRAGCPQVDGMDKGAAIRDVVRGFRGRS